MGPGGHFPGMRRRALLAATGSLALAGCLGTGDGDSGGAAGDGETLDSHRGAADLGSQPTLGPEPSGADAVIVAFEDPSCPNCRRFHEGAFRRIRSEWTEVGDAAFVFRGFPVVYPWGDPAAHALEAAHDRSAAAHWALLDRFYGRQSSLGADSVLDEAASFLDAETDVDGAAVAADARDGAFDDAVQSDLDAGEAAGFSATPSFLLFRDGSLVTSLTGAKSFETFESALEL